MYEMHAMRKKPRTKRVRGGGEDDDRLEELPGGTKIDLVKRSVNAFTSGSLVRGPTASGYVFAKAHAVANQHQDLLVVDAANGLVIREMDPRQEWTIRVATANQCGMKDAGDVAVAVTWDRRDAKSHGYPGVVIGYDNIKGDPVYKRPLSSLAGSFVNFVARFIEFSLMTGFCHNDLHAANIMIDDRGGLRMIDYGRAEFSAATREKFRTNNVLRLLTMERAGFKNLKPWADPFGAFRPTFDGAGFYWMGDMITIAMQLYEQVIIRLTPGHRRGTVPEFITWADKRPVKANFTDQDDLIKKIGLLSKSLNCLLPGLVVLAIVLKHTSSENRPSILHRNSVLTGVGGNVIVSICANDLFRKNYMRVLKYAFQAASFTSASSDGVLNLTLPSGRKIDSLWELVEQFFLRPLDPVAGFEAPAPKPYYAAPPEKPSYAAPPAISYYEAPAPEPYVQAPTPKKRPPNLMRQSQLLNPTRGTHSSAGWMKWTLRFKRAKQG